ncbi:hypothetical protein C8J56DRAFT_855311 [Mycena floridula]|nr:hypothetical protein C8J56DRAFT_855311 [Mycena floridula]
MFWLKITKIPLLLVAVAGVNISVTPPNPPPGSDETIIPNDCQSECLSPMVFKLNSVSKIICWLPTCLEIVVILASELPDSPILQPVLSKRLVGYSCAEQIHVSTGHLVGSAACFGGALLRLMCYRALGSLFTFEMSIRRDHKLVTTGPYAIVRHPSYTALIFTFTGVICCNFAPGSWVTSCGIVETWMGQGFAALFFVIVGVVILGLLSRMHKEDEMLRKRFGPEWFHLVFCLVYFDSYVHSRLNKYDGC